MAGFQNDAGTVQQEAGFGFDGRFYDFSYSDGLTAHAGGGQANATQLASMFNTVATVATIGDSVQLPPSRPGRSIGVVNNGANAMQVFAQNGSSDTINGVAGSTGVTQMAGSTVFYQCTKAGTWTAQDLGCGTNGNYPTLAYQANLTAGTTHSAAGGTAITSSLAEFDTVANANDCGTLPPAQPGMQISVINNAAVNTMTVYAATQALGGVSGGDTINGSASTTIAAGSVTLFFCTKAGKWLTK